MASPFLVGIYHDSKLIDIISSDEKISDKFPMIYRELNQKYKIKSVYFVNGPGSYMSIKLIYIFLQTISIVDNIEIKSALGFYFNNNQPIKALGNKYFIQKDGIIELKSYNTKLAQEYRVPLNIDETIFGKDLEPVYILPVT
jgi:hypothetical protein